MTAGFELPLNPYLCVFVNYFFVIVFCLDEVQSEDGNGVYIY